jgi:hypothetical protein
MGYLVFSQVSYRFLVFSAISGIFFNGMEFLCNGSPEILSSLYLFEFAYRVIQIHAFVSTTWS